MNEVRCLNCLNRFQVQLNTEQAECPKCNTQYRISWPKPDQPKIRGIVK
jgi:DNA-directed RNA polymerase subunit RPC12/RpoP